MRPRVFRSGFSAGRSPKTTSSFCLTPDHYRWRPSLNLKRRVESRTDGRMARSCAEDNDARLFDGYGCWGDEKRDFSHFWLKVSRRVGRETRDKGNLVAEQCISYRGRQGKILVTLPK